MPKDAIPPLPEGYTLQSFFRKCVWYCLWGGRFPFANSDTVQVQWNGSAYSFKAAPARGGGATSGLWPWMYDTHRELDPSLVYSKGKCAYISPQNPLVTIGLVDLDSGATVQATAGTYLALQDIPAATASGYNVPTDPIPGSGVAAPSGSPLVGDADATTAKWLLIKPVC
jgi:hypothetical protein